MNTIKKYYELQEEQEHSKNLNFNNMEQETFKTAEELEQDFLNYLENTGYPELYKEIYKLGEVDFYNLYKYTEDYYNASSGNVYGLIYYEDTKPFAYNFFDEIDELLNDLGDNKRYSLTDMTRIAWELMISEIENFKYENEENEIYLIDKN